jgi:hypothetical protein
LSEAKYFGPTVPLAFRGILSCAELSDYLTIIIDIDIYVDEFISAFIHIFLVGISNNRFIFGLHRSETGE